MRLPRILFAAAVLEAKERVQLKSMSRPVDLLRVLSVEALALSSQVDSLIISRQESCSSKSKKS